MKRNPCPECGGYWPHRRGCSKHKPNRLRPVSQKKALERQAYYGEWKPRVMAERLGCEGRVAIPEVKCWGAHTLHHVWLTKQGGPLMDRGNVLRLCLTHHGWVHDHPTQAKRRGLLLNAQGGSE